MAMVYRAVRPIGLDDGLIQEAGRAIDAIRKKHGGVCPPAEYVERARPEDSPTHATLDWDADAALERQLLAQAREIVRVVVHEVAGQTPDYVNVSVTTVRGETVERGTVSPEAVAARPDWASQAERELLARIGGDCRTHGYLPLAQRILAFLATLEQEQGAAPAA
jgi:hypothetical protein